MNIITEHLSKIFNTYTKDSYYEDMKKAVEIYIEKTGRMDEESQEYESRMNSFNDWFVFNYRKDGGKRIVEKYIEDENLDEELANAFTKANYSVFYFHKINFRKQIVIKDILHKEKFILAKDSEHLALVENDLFVGRAINYQNNYYLLSGVCTLPQDILSVLKKESKKIIKENNFELEEEFLLQIEALKTKSLHYGHLESAKVFKFPKKSK
jgi:hypothetical protein